MTEVGDGSTQAGISRPAPEPTEARLADTPLFSGLSHASLTRLVGLGELTHLAPGEFLIREGDPADALYVVLDGELQVSKRSGTTEVMLDRVGPGSLQGEVAALEGGRRLASVRAVTPAEVFRLPVEALAELLSTGPDVALAIITTAVQRLRGMEAALRELDKLAALGRLAAGVAHEMNNPAAAAARAVAGLAPAVAELARLTPPRDLPRLPDLTAARPTGLERADRIDAMCALTDPGAAAALVDEGWTAEALRDYPAEVLAWLAAEAQVADLMTVLETAVARISELVGAVKGYSFLDQAPVQKVNVRSGLDQTLILLGHRLGTGIRLTAEYDPDLPLIEALGTELNQVWTNLIDNAIDAMEGAGELTVRAGVGTDGRGVTVEICDSGPGIAESVRAHLFEPFYTTKPPGQGVGLGLHIAHTVVARHGGRIEVDSAPGRTCFCVMLREALPGATTYGE